MKDFSKTETRPIMNVASKKNSRLLHSRVTKASLGNEWVFI